MFHRRLRELRERAGYSQEQMAELLTTTPQQYSRWETKNVPRQQTINKLADFFNVSADYLLGRDDVPQFRIKEDDLTPDEMLLIQAYRSGRIWDLLKLVNEVSPKEGQNLERILSSKKKPKSEG